MEFCVCVYPANIQFTPQRVAQDPIPPRHAPLVCVYSANVQFTPLRVAQDPIPPDMPPHPFLLPTTLGCVSEKLSREPELAQHNTRSSWPHAGFALSEMSCHPQLWFLFCFLGSGYALGCSLWVSRAWEAPALKQTAVRVHVLEQLRESKAPSAPAASHLPPPTAICWACRRHCHA